MEMPPSDRQTDRELNVVNSLFGYSTRTQNRTKRSKMNVVRPLRAVCTQAKVAKLIGSQWTRSHATAASTVSVEAPQLPQGLETPESAKPSSDARQIFRDAVAKPTVRNNWTREEISAIYYQPLLDLAYQAVSRDIFNLPLIFHSANFPTRAPFTDASITRLKSSYAPS